MRHYRYLLFDLDGTVYLIVGRGHRSDEDLDLPEDFVAQLLAAELVLAFKHDEGRGDRRDQLAQLEGVPSDPVICQWQKIVPAMDGLCSITSALPVADEDSDLANAYAWGDEDDEHEHAHHDGLDDLDEEDLMDQEPFLLFE